MASLVRTHRNTNNDNRREKKPRKMVRPRNQLPTRSAKKRAIRGRQTGRQIDAGAAKGENGIQSMEAFFDAQYNVAAEKEEEDEEEEDSKPRATTRSITAKTKTPKKRVRLSIDDDDENDDEGSQSEDEIRDDQVAALTQNYVAKIQSTMNSPSDLSKVSTAPPTPADEKEVTRFASEDNNNNDDDEHDATEGLLTQENDQVMVAAQATTTTTTTETTTNTNEKPQLQDRVESPEPAFPPMDLEDLGPPAHSDNEDEEGFDLAPPEQEEDNDSQDVPAATEPEDKKPKAQQESETEDEEDNDSKEGYNIVHDPETPASVREQRAEDEKAALKRRGRKKKSDVAIRKASKKTKRNVVFSPQGVPAANREYKTVPVADLVEESPEGEQQRRRSQRLRIEPLAYWKNEHYEYGANEETGLLGEAMGDMPVVKNVVKALPTPYKKREAKATAAKRGRKPAAAKRSSGTAEDEDDTFDISKLKEKYQVLEGEEAVVWDDVADDSAELKVVSYFENMKSGKLPVSSARSKEDGNVVGAAAQAFNIPDDPSADYAGYIMGNLTLPPKGIKDAESVGPCSQTFTVCACQPKALEVAYGDPDLPEGTLDPETAQRFYLSPCDLFRVPPGNCYRLHNHSKTTEAFLTWTIIRPRATPSG
eukprot:scaffold834_cov123-Cylindrotheca_fusiformis.AAC.46